MTCQSRNPPTTTTSTGVNVRHRDGISRCIRLPSSWSRRHSATSATTVAIIASSIAPSFAAVGLVVKRVSTVADSERPCGAGPVRLVKTPTKLGRRFGSANPVRKSFCGSVGSLIPGNVANVPASDEVISRRVHSGPSARYIGMVATTTLRSMTVIRCSSSFPVTLTKSALSAASLALGGAVPSTVPPPRLAMSRSTSHGTVDRHGDRRQRDQRRGHVAQLPTLWPVHRRGGLHHRKQRRQHREHEADQACDHRHPAGGLHVGSHESVSRGRARIGPRRVQPRTVSEPSSTATSGAPAAGTIRS